MKHAISLFPVFLLFAWTCRGQDEALVRKTFDHYKTSILNDKGEEAAQCVDSRTIQYYNDLLTHVKTADSATVEKMSILDKFMVLTIRHRATQDEILSFDGKGLLVYAIQKGMVGKNSVSNNTIGDITIDGDFAKGQLIANGQKMPAFFHFYKETGIWKLDLTALFPLATIAFKGMAADSEQPENDFLLLLLEMVSGSKPGSEIWKPTKSK
ncbi:MAG: hypothetical protein HUU01_04925 [Saprospiraceae bacterium]|nr:hypothetical protein [Saprospiraceae bacterium]